MFDALPTDTPAYDIEVISIKRLKDCRSLKAFASIRFGGIEIHGLRIVQQPGQKAWVSLPQVEYNRDGKKCYYPMITIHDKRLKAAITQAVLEAWHNFRERIQ